MLVFVLTMLGIAMSFVMQAVLRPVFLAEAETRVLQMVTNAINQSVFEHTKTLKYDEMIHYQTNRQGDIILMQPNLQKVNQFISQVIQTIQLKMQEISEQNIRVPIAHAFGLDLLAGIGPRLNIRMMPLGLVKPPQIEDSFETAGINQTRHKIYVVILGEVQLLVPFVQEKIQIETKVPVTEATILGKVPDIYVGVEGGLLGEVLQKNQQ